MTRDDVSGIGRTTTAYRGLTTATADDLGLVTTTVRNRQGLLSSVTDALNAADPGHHYFVTNHLGSIATATDSNGSPDASHTERDSYDPWGKRRSASNGADDPSCALTSLNTRGFTCHEHMNDRKFVGRRMVWNE